MGLGQGGQVIAVFPALDMVVVVTSQNWLSGRKSMPFPLFDQYILPAVSDRAPSSRLMSACPIGRFRSPVRHS
jgi:hypothetical protein